MPLPLTVCNFFDYFQCYASGSNLIILDGKLNHLQTILGSNFGYNDVQITCMHVAELTGKVSRIINFITLVM